jgi:hypothetical protein
MLVDLERGGVPIPDELTAYTRAWADKHADAASRAEHVFLGLDLDFRVEPWISGASYGCDVLDDYPMAAGVLVETKEVGFRLVASMWVRGEHIEGRYQYRAGDPLAEHAIRIAVQDAASTLVSLAVGE